MSDGDSESVPGLGNDGDDTKQRKAWQEEESKRRVATDHLISIGNNISYKKKKKMERKKKDISPSVPVATAQVTLAAIQQKPLGKKSLRKQKLELVLSLT